MITDIELAVLCKHGYKDRKNHSEGTIVTDAVNVKYTRAIYYSPVREVEVVGYYLNDNDLVLTVRGTEATSNSRRWYTNWFDFVRDLRVLPWRTMWGWGHAGFYKGAMYWLREHKGRIPKDVNLYIVGHSMGAQIGAWMSFYLNNKVKRVVLFAEPKGFFRSSARMFTEMGLHEKTTTYITKDDWIRNVPPWGKRSTETTHAGDGSHDIDDYIKALSK